MTFHTGGRRLEKVPILLKKGVSALAKNHAATVFLWQRDAVWSKVFMVMLAV